MRWLQVLGKAAGALVFPWSCALCGAPSSNDPLCPHCRSEVLLQASALSHSACPRCALPTGPFADLAHGCAACRGCSLGFDAAVALGPYTGAIRALCLSLKHERNSWLAPYLSQLIVEARHGDLARLPAETWIVPVPLHWWRFWHRGYNQAEALAEALGKTLQFRVHRLLRRIVATRRLSSLSATERTYMMRGIFHVRSDPRLTGRTVLLVDDILTTGSTCGAAAKVLRSAGAAQIVVVVVGRAVRTSL
jgi:ComF family protein